MIESHAGDLAQQLLPAIRFIPVVVLISTIRARSSRRYSSGSGS